MEERWISLLPKRPPQVAAGGRLNHVGGYCDNAGEGCIINHLAEIPRRVTAGAYAVVVCDGVV